MLWCVLHQKPAAEVAEKLIELESLLGGARKKIGHPASRRKSRVTPELGTSLVVENRPPPGHYREWLNRRSSEVLEVGRIGVLHEGRAEERSG